MRDKYEERQRELDPNRSELQRKARMEADARLAQRNIPADAGDLDQEVADLLDAVERFEAMVESLGGDRFVEDIGTTEPDDPEFVLPARQPGERAVAYQERVLIALEKLRARQA